MTATRRTRAELEAQLEQAPPELEGVIAAALAAGEASDEWCRAEQALSYRAPAIRKCRNVLGVVS